MRWLVAGSILLALRLSAAVDPDLTPQQADIPFLTGTAPPDDSGYFQANLNPLVVQRTLNAYGGLADSADEDVDFGWRIPFTNNLSFGYDTGLNAFRQDQTIWDYDEATSEVSTAFMSKPSIEIQSGTNLTWTDFVQSQRSYTDNVPGYTDSTQYGTEAAWTPIKDTTTLKADASAQQTYNFNGSILDQDLYGGSIDQKIPWVPFTLHTAGALADDTSPTPLLSASNSTTIDASVLWKVAPSTSWTTGIQRQDATIPASDILQDTDTYFTQLSVQTLQSWNVSMGIAHDQRIATQAGQFLSNGSDDILSLGVLWKIGDRFNAGAGLDYRVLQSQTPAPAIGTPPASALISAGASF